MKKLNLKQRLHGTPKPIVALTGGIATGKSTVNRLLKSFGLTLIDADQLVKEIYQEDEMYSWLRSHLPEVIKEVQGEWSIDFSLLRKEFFSQPSLKQELEQLIYQKLPAYFRKHASLVPASQKTIIYDVPLLYEKQLDGQVDMVVVVYCPPEIQLKRLMERDRMDAALAAKVLLHQISIEEKKMKADVVIDNSGSEEQLKQNVHYFYQQYKDLL